MEDVPGAFRGATEFAVSFDGGIGRFARGMRGLKKLFKAPSFDVITFSKLTFTIGAMPPFV